MSGAERFLLLTAAGHRIALPYRQVAEVREPCSLSPVPGSPSWCCGVFHATGQAVAVVDLAQYLGEAGMQQAGRLVLLDRQLGGLAMQVEQVESLLLSASDRSLTVSGQAVAVWDGGELVQEIAAAFSR